MCTSFGCARLRHAAVMWPVGLFVIAAQARALDDPSGGALAGERLRVIVSSDIGGSDPDDFQSMVHYLVYADVFDTEGLVSSPPGSGRTSHIEEVIAAYETDYPNLSTYSPDYPTPAALRAITKQGATDPAPAAGFSTATDGSGWIITRANASDPRPLYILVWGSITDVAQAVHDDPGIKSRIRVYSIGSWNTSQDPDARDYLYDDHPELWWVECDSTFRGMYVGGDQTGDLGNSTFVSQHVDGHGALGDLFYSKKTDIKMGDTPSVLYLLRGDPAVPTVDHWGGRFLASAHGGYNWHDDPDPAYRESTYDGAKTVNVWRESYLRDWQKRMDRCAEPNPDPDPGGIGRGSGCCSGAPGPRCGWLILLAGFGLAASGRSAAHRASTRPNAG